MTVPSHYLSTELRLPRQMAAPTVGDGGKQEAAGYGDAFVHQSLSLRERSEVLVQLLLAARQMFLATDPAGAPM